MKSRSRLIVLSVLFAASIAAVFMLGAASSDAQARTDAAVHVDATASTPVANKPLAEYRSELLDLAFKTATALPVVPHIKNRSRAQEAVVEACFELDQPRRALAYVEKIDNWRRGVGYADFAFYCARHGDTAEVQQYLDLANQVSEKTQGDDAQDWQRDRIRVKIASTHAILGQTEKAAQFESGTVDSESGKVDAARAMVSDADAFTERIKEVDADIATGGFDQTRNALETCAQLFNRFYADGERRTQVEEKIKTSWGKLPVLVRLDLMIELTQFALNHGDRTKALDLLKDTQAIVDEAQWTAEYHVPTLARLARLRHLAGDTQRARADADAALTMFDAEREQIGNIYRAGALRPLAEAYASMGDAAGALKVYKKVVEEGLENPNSRPRAEDLSATCCSMAVQGVEPDAALRARLAQIYEKLGDPW
jgi:tetratricopeptide (TPR) repeat protein